MAIYLPRHDTQFEPRTWSSGLDCNMAAAADMARFGSLGLIDRRHDWFRDRARNSDGTPDRSGGTNIDQAQDVLDGVGVASTVYDGADGRAWANVISDLLRAPIIAHGDYGAVPVALRGPIDRAYTGPHAVLFHALSGASIRVGDGLSDDWMLWPVAVARAYMVAFPGAGVTCLVPVIRKVAAKVATANVRAQPSRGSRVITTISPRSRIHCGGTQRGEVIGANATWFRVWTAGRIGFVHSSVARWA